MSSDRRKGWRPISTAPKDGTPFLAGIFFPGDKRWQIMVVRARPQWTDWYSVPGDYSYRPKYWMPLPAHPSEDSE